MSPGPIAKARTKLLVVLPLTMMLLVAATGFFTLQTARRIYEDRLPGLSIAVDRSGSGGGRVSSDSVDAALGQLGLQVAAISLIAAILGLAVAVGVARPLERMRNQLAAVASGDLRGGLDIASTSELDSLGGAVNEVITAVQRRYLQSMTGAVITLDAAGRVIGASAAAESTLGYSEEDLAGRRFAEVFTPAPGSRASLGALESAIERREPVTIDDLEILTADRRPLRIGISASYLQQPVPGGSSREVVGVMVEFKDLDQVRSLRARLQQADQLVALGTVTAGVAHEIRNPLASLRGLTELIARDLSAADSRHRYVQAMLTSIDRMNRLVADLLLFSGLPQTHDDGADVDLADAAAETVAMARAAAGGRAITIALDQEADGPAFVRGRRERVVQVLTNLVMNAAQAEPDGGTVTVRLFQRGDQALVSVHNSGSFIAPSVRRQLFVPFFTTRGGGTGLGLAIARQIVSGMNGRIEVESTRAAGTTFTIELPLSIREEAAFV
jgi:two-component system sensor histidine kinase AtoS